MPRLPLLLLALLPLVGCAARTDALLPPPALAGPPLSLAGQYGDRPVAGTLDRSCMVGVGDITLHGFPPDTLSCAARLDSPPNSKGRVRGILACSDQDALLITMRTLGPDQGFALGRSSTSPELLVFFYHPSYEEAVRRLPDIIADINEARLRQEKEH